MKTALWQTKFRGNLTFKHTRLPERSLLALVLLAFSLVQVVGFVESMMSHWSGQPGAAYATSYALEIWLPRLLYPLIAVFLIVHSGRCFIQKSNLLTIPVAGVLVVAAIQAGADKISLAIFAAVFFVVWINQWMPNPSGDGEIRFERYVVQVLIIYLIAPIILLCMLHLANMIDNLPGRFEFLIDRTSNDGFFRGESFRGFARDRIAYSYLCGIAFLYLLSVRRFNVGVLICLGLLLIALSMASSRGVLIAIVAAVCLMVVSKRIGLFALAGGLAVLFAAVFISDRPGFWGDPGNRISIFFAFGDHVLANPAGLLIGEGRFGSDVLLGGGALVRPHSWPLNSTINFGVLTTAAWTVFLYRFFKKLSTAGRSVCIYFVTVGLFHNGFDAYFFSMEQLIAFLLAMTLGMNMAPPNSRKDLYESNSF